MKHQKLLNHSDECENYRQNIRICSRDAYNNIAVSRVADWMLKHENALPAPSWISYEARAIGNETWMTSGVYTVWMEFPCLRSFGAYSAVKSHLRVGFKRHGQTNAASSYIQVLGAINCNLLKL